MIEVHSTKAFMGLACAHAQFFDLEPDGSPGDCASLHGYDRTVKFTFSGHVDEQGWLVPFGELKKVKQFLEYYFDHTTVLPANDKRVDSIPQKMLGAGGLLGTIRVLPYGVSMEMSSLFIWEHVNPWVHKTTHGRAYVSRVESIEHERNSAFITVDRETAKTQATKYNSKNVLMLPMNSWWDYARPTAVLRGHNAWG